MMGAALLGLFSKTRLPSEHPQDDTSSVVRLVANLFVVMTSLVLGLMLNSAGRIELTDQLRCVLSGEERLHPSASPG
jgi:hypothetical protein